MQLRLNTLPNVIRTYNRVIRLYMADELETSKARTLGYLLAGRVNAERVQKELQIEERLQAIEERLDEGRA